MEQLKWYADKVFAVLQSQRFLVAALILITYIAGKETLFTDEEIADIAMAVIAVVEALALIVGYSYRAPSRKGDEQRTVVVELPKSVPQDVEDTIRDVIVNTLSSK